MSGDDARQRLLAYIAWDLATAPAPKRDAPALKTEAQIIAYARRCLDGHRMMYADLVDTRESLIAEQREGGLYPYMLSVFNSAAKHLLVLGQSAYVLDAKPEVAKAVFGDLKQWFPYFDASIAARLEGLAPDALDERAFLDPAICFLLAGDRGSLERIANVDFARVFDLSFKHIKTLRAWRDFTLNLLDLTAGRAKAVLARGQAPVRPGDAIEGYDKMLMAIAREDAAAFEASRHAAAKAYPARVRRRDISINWFGEGRVAQAATFDAMGTALCQLARWRGLKVSGDERLHPYALLD